jgi:hypothetical protein
MEMLLKIKSLIDKEIEHRSLFNISVFIMNSLIIKLLLDMLTELSLPHLNLILPLEQQLLELIRDKGIVEDCELGSWKEGKMSDLCHSNHVVEKMFLIEDKSFNPIIIASHHGACLENCEVAEHNDHNSS